MKNINKKQIFYFLIGTLLIGLGLSFQIKANIGLGAYDALTDNLSRATNITFGQWVYIVSFMLLVISAIIERKKIKILSLLAGFLIGTFVDMFLFILGDFELTTLVFRSLGFFIGINILTLGIAFNIRSEFIIAPYEVFPLAVADRLDITYRSAKVFTETCGILTAMLVGFVSGIGLGGIWIGTVISTFTLGFFISFYLKYISKAK